MGFIFHEINNIFRIKLKYSKRDDKTFSADFSLLNLDTSVQLQYLDT